MQVAILLSIAGLFVTTGMAALALANRLGRLEQKVDTVYELIMTRGIDIRVGGRRRSDIAADSGR